MTMMTMMTANAVPGVVDALCGLLLLRTGQLIGEGDNTSDVPPAIGWALGWLLVSAFGSLLNDAFEVEDKLQVADASHAGGDPSGPLLRQQLLQFFSLLPRLPGSDGVRALTVA